MILCMLSQGYIIVSKCSLLQRLRHRERVGDLILSSLYLLLYLMQRYFHLLLRGRWFERLVLWLLLLVDLGCFRCLKMALVNLNRANEILSPHRSFFIWENIGSNLLFFLFLFRGASWAHLWRRLLAQSFFQSISDHYMRHLARRDLIYIQIIRLNRRLMLLLIDAILYDSGLQWLPIFKMFCSKPVARGMTGVDCLHLLWLSIPMFHIWSLVSYITLLQLLPGITVVLALSEHLCRCTLSECSISQLHWVGSNLSPISVKASSRW